jgi:hypothetical protein
MVVKEAVLDPGSSEVAGPSRSGTLIVKPWRGNETLEIDHFVLFI